MGNLEKTYEKAMMPYENLWQSMARRGRKMKCDAGIDFAQTCPVGWSYVARGPQGPECKAPPDFYTETWG